MGTVRMYERAAITVLAALMLVGATGLIGYEQGLSTLSISQTVDPQRIFLKDSGVKPETATVTIRLEAPQQPQRLMTDLILVVDRSASFELGQAIDAAKRIIDRLGPNDRVGLVSFATDATLDARLTPIASAQALRDALSKLVSEGKTALGEGIAVATDELVVSGRREAALIAILLTDGRTNSGRDPLEEARKANERAVTLYSVGIGRFVNRDALTQIVEKTGGQFFPAYNDAIVDQILRVTVPANAPVAKNMEIVETLSENVQYQEALENAPASVIHNFDETTTLTWQRSSLEAGEVWNIRYTVSGNEEGFFPLHRSPSFVRFTDFRDREIQSDLPLGLVLEVRPRPPIVTPAFSVTPDSPTTYDEVQFTDKSKVEKGKIVGWLWSLGDSSTSLEQNPIHRYAVDGSYAVKLTVTSDEGVEASSSSTITVFTPKLAVRRTIETFIPQDEIIPGLTFRVTLDIIVNVKFNGLGIDENVPSSWQVTTIENSSAQVRVEDSQWLFSEVLEQGTTKTIIYEVTVPSNQRAGMFAIDGTVSSASPDLSRSVTGESQIDVLSGFPIAVVVAHWDTSNRVLDLKSFLKHTIDLNQILQAISWWREGVEVPSTEDVAGKKQKIDFKTMQELVAYWLTDTSVFDPLPK